MALKWKKESEVSEPAYHDSGIPSEISDSGEILSLSISEIMKTHHPRRFVEKVEKWCIRLNSETVGYKNKLSNKLESQAVTKILNIVPKSRDFTIREIINLLGGEGITDGTLQRKALGVLICAGFVEKKLIEYINKKGELKAKFVYRWVSDESKHCPYLNLEKQKCTFDWKSAKTSKYY